MSVGVVNILPDGSLMLFKMLQGHVSRVRALDCHGDRVLSGSDDRSVKLWSLSPGKFESEIQGVQDQHFRIQTAITQELCA